MPNPKLTLKQWTFSELVAGGQEKATAYRMAYDAEGMKQSSVRVEASRTASLPNVREAIEWLRDNRPAQTLRNPTDLIGSLQDIAQSDYSPSRTRLGALAELMKWQKMI